MHMAEMELVTRLLPMSHAMDYAMPLVQEFAYYSHGYIFLHPFSFLKGKQTRSYAAS